MTLGRTPFLFPLLLLLTTAVPLAPAPGFAQPQTPAPPPPAPSAADTASPTPALRQLTLDDALELALKNNRDLQAARERLRGSHADVERALAALLPQVSLQGKLTINAPVVSLTLDQSGQVFGSALQGAQITDLQNQTGNGRGPAATLLLNTYCGSNGNPPTGVQTPGIQQACSMLQNPIAAAGSLDSLLTAANISAPIVPQVQLDGLLAATMPLVAPALYPALKGAKLNFKSQEKQLEVTAVQVLTTVATGFFTAAGNEELVGARRHAIEVAQKTLDNAKVRLAAGVVNKVEVSRAALALIQAEQRLLESMDALASSYRSLATMILIPADSFKVVPPPAANTEMPSEDKLIDQALHQRPELLSTRLQANYYGQQVFSSWLRWSPTLSLFGNIRLTNATGFAGRIDSYAIGLQLDWLIFDGFSRDAQRHSFEAQQRDALLRLDQFHDTITDDVVNGRRAVLVRKQGLETAAQSVSIAQETLELVRTQYQAGTATQLDLLNAQDALIQAEVGVAQARFDLSLAVLNIRRLTGENLTSGK